ncbi:hypothetical protein Salat_2151600, partial [Sesamum alatum]
MSSPTKSEAKGKRVSTDMDLLKTQMNRTISNHSQSRSTGHSYTDNIDADDFGCVRICKCGHGRLFVHLGLTQIQAVVSEVVPGMRELTVVCSSGLIHPCAVAQRMLYQ